MAAAVFGIILLTFFQQLQTGLCGVDTPAPQGSDTSHHAQQTKTLEHQNPVGHCMFSLARSGWRNSIAFLANCPHLQKSRTLFKHSNKKFVKTPLPGGTHNTLQATKKNIDAKKTTIKWPFTERDFELPIQSPIDVITTKITERKDLPKLMIFEPQLSDVQANFYNSGHTVFVRIRGQDHDVKPTLEGGPLPNKFVFEQMHFHWGSQDVWGSEHMVDGEAFAVEIHMVHFNSKYKNFDEALDKDDGLAVLTIFAEVIDDDNHLLHPLYNFLPKIKEPEDSVSLPWEEAMQWTMSALNVNPEYYAYPGSLTTPMYNQNVAFIILPKSITIAHKQVCAFRDLHGHGMNGFIDDNKRNLQPLHHRPIIRGDVAPLERSILLQVDD